MVTVVITKEETLYLQKGVPSIELNVFDSIHKMQHHIDANPMILGDLVLIENAFEFSNANVKVLLDIINSPFFSMVEDFIYYYVTEANFSRINAFIKNDDELKEKVVVIPIQDALSREIVLRILKYEFRKILNEKATTYTIKRMSKKDHYDMKNLKADVEMPDVSLAQPLLPAEDEIVTASEEFDQRKLRASNADSILNKKYIFMQDEYNSRINSMLMVISAKRLAEVGKILIFENDRELYLENLLSNSDVGYMTITVDSFKNIHGMKKQVLASKEKIILVSNKGQNKYFNMDTLLLLIDTFLAELLDFVILAKDIKSIGLTVHRYIYACSSDCSSVMRMMRESIEQLSENVDFILVDDAVAKVPIFKKSTFLELLQMQGIEATEENVNSGILVDEEGMGDAVLRIITR